jgi:hypothetical protein
MNPKGKGPGATQDPQDPFDKTKNTTTSALASQAAGWSLRKELARLVVQNVQTLGDADLVIAALQPAARRKR